MKSSSTAIQIQSEWQGRYEAKTTFKISNFKTEVIWSVVMAPNGTLYTILNNLKL